MVVSFLVSLLCVIPSTQPAIERGRDPWVFRCVLDDRPRVIVVALSKDLWCAYDAANCSLLKVWRGDIDLTGSVYDTRHGPQPRACGTIVVDAAAVAPPTLQLADGSSRRLQYEGYRFERDSLVLRFRSGEVILDESPEYLIIDGQVRFLRRVTLTGLPGGAHVALGLTRNDNWLAVGVVLSSNASGKQLKLEGDSSVIVSLVCGTSEVNQ